MADIFSLADGAKCLLLRLLTSLCLSLENGQNMWRAIKSIEVKNDLPVRFYITYTDLIYKIKDVGNMTYPILDKSNGG